MTGRRVPATDLINTSIATTAAAAEPKRTP